MTVWTDLSAIAIIISAAWLVSEVFLSRITYANENETTDLDKSSLRIIWLTIIPSLLIGIFIGSQRISFITSGSFIISIAGLLLVILGLAVRWTAILTLKRSFTSNINIRNGQQLVSRGIYGIVRHPSYSGALLSFLGLGITFASWLSVAVIIVPIFWAFRHRITIEEQALIGFWGDECLSYCARTSRLLPKIY